MKMHGLWKESFEDKLTQHENVEEACQESHAIILLTEWDEFKGLDYGKFYENMEKPSFIFDGRNLLEEKKMTEIGFQYCRLGKKSGWY